MTVSPMPWAKLGGKVVGQNVRKRLQKSRHLCHCGCPTPIMFKQQILIFWVQSHVQSHHFTHNNNGLKKTSQIRSNLQQQEFCFDKNKNTHVLHFRFVSCVSPPPPPSLPIKRQRGHYFVSHEHPCKKISVTMGNIMSSRRLHGNDK